MDRLRERAYDVIIRDIRMPEVDGAGLYREVALRHPQLTRRLVFITGDSLGPESTEFLRRTGVITLGKPFDLDGLRHVIRQALSAP